MKFKGAVIFILSILLIFNTKVYARERSTYDCLRSSGSEILTRLEDAGLANVRINEFLNEMDSQADALKVPENLETLEEYFLFILFNIVLENEDYADVCGVFDTVFQEELNYIVENDMQIPESFNEFFMSVMYNAIKQDYSGGEEEYVPAEPEITEPEPEQPTENEPEPVFYDIDEAVWAKPYIIELYEKKIIDGYLGKIFRPNNGVTRAELAKTVCKAFLSEKHMKEKSDYSDISDKLWYCDYVKICEYYSIFDRICDNEFKGGEYVTRQEMCTVIYRAFLNSHKNLSQYSKHDFPDMNTLSPYAVEAVEKLHSAKIINGFEDYCFHPFYETTRAEMCKVVGLLLSEY